MDKDTAQAVELVKALFLSDKALSKALRKFDFQQSNRYTTENKNLKTDFYKTIDNLQLDPNAMVLYSFSASKEKWIELLQSLETVLEYILSKFTKNSVIPRIDSKRKRVVLIILGENITIAYVRAKASMTIHKALTGETLTPEITVEVKKNGRSS